MSGKKVPGSTMLLPAILRPVLVMRQITASVVFTLFCTIEYNLGKDRVSKCVQNHIKAQEYLSEDAVQRNLDEEEGGAALDVFKVVNEVTGDCVKSQNLPQSYNVECRTIKSESESKAEPSFVTDFNNGRLGNQLSSFASIYSLAKAGGLRPMVTHRSMSALSTYFANIEVPVLEKTYCNPCIHFKFHKLKENSPTSRNGHAYKLAEAYSNLLPVYAPLLPDLRQMLVFKPEFQKAAQIQLVKARKAFTLDSPTYVGVHNRRTDYKSHLKKGFGADLVGPGYFNIALQLFRKTLKNPIFIVVSDDIPWARSNVQGSDVFYPEPVDQESTSPMTKEEFDIGLDLALLAACNHTIATYGTFGLWGALLAGGAAIMSTQVSCHCDFEKTIMIIIAYLVPLILSTHPGSGAQAPYGGGGPQELCLCG